MTSLPENVSSTSAPELSAEINAEIDAAMKDMEAAGAAAAAAKASKPAAIRGPRVVQAGREHRHGKVVSVGPTDIFIEFGPKELGVLPRIQFTDDTLVPVVGADVEVVIDKFEASEGIFLCSRPGMVQKADWEMLEVGQVVEAKVTGVATGKDSKQVGLELEVAGHKAFMPASQISFDRIPDLSIFVGEKLKCAISRIERMGKGNIVVSRRDIMAEERKANAEKILANLVEGATVEGTVRKIMPFGAFVDLGGIDGLIHISDISYDRMGFGEKAVAKYVKEGQKVNVRIMKIERNEADPTAKPKIGLGLKQVAGDPFATATESITEGAEVNGKVVRITEFGAFIELGPNVDGLVHISEIDHKRIGKVEEVLKVDEVVRAKVLKIDPGTRRISLSLKALKTPPEMPAQAQGEGKEGGGGGKGGFGGGRGGFGGGGKGKGDRDKFGGRTAEEILKETPALRRAREKNKQMQFKGGLG